MIIAIDGMGGDDAPHMVIEGMAEAIAELPDLHFMIFGDETALSKGLSAFPVLSKNTQIIHTDTVITAEDKPSQAVRRGRDSSMGRAIQAVKDGEAAVAVSAGNTGALMAISKIMLRTIPGIDRPAIISPLPTLKGECVMLDMGANIECDAENLVQFAVMGAAFARVVLGIQRPRVALLNVGVEELKGNEEVKKAAEILKVSELPMKFTGFTEGDGITSGNNDVIVTDGFTGNVALKTTEGTARFITKLLREAFEKNMATKLGYVLAKSGLNELRDHLDPNNHNGAMFLGLGGLVVKSHGGANARGFASAIRVAHELAQNDLNSLLIEDLKNFNRNEENVAQAVVGE